MLRAIIDDEETAGGSTVWHLCWQAAIGREFVVDLYPRFRERLIDAHRRPGRVLVNYTLLPTEIHVVTEIPPGDSARAVARVIGNVVARWVRAAQPAHSPVFAGPHRAHPIRSDEELRTEARMLAWRAAPNQATARALPRTAATWPCGKLRSTLNTSAALATATPPRSSTFRPSTTSSGRQDRLARVRLRTLPSSR